MVWDNIYYYWCSTHAIDNLNYCKGAFLKSIHSLKNHFLVAVPSLNDPNFSKSVILVYEHDEEAGAMGIIINKPMRITVGDVLRHLEMVTEENIEEVNDMPVLLGGPIAQEQGFLIVPKGSIELNEKPVSESEDIIISTSKNLLQTLAVGKAPKDILVSLGYSGWFPGQLEEEIAHNSWLVVPYQKEILFQIPFEKRWVAAAAAIGVDIHRLAAGSGHA